MRKRSAIELLLIIFLILLTACSTRQVIERYHGSTAQRLTSDLLSLEMFHGITELYYYIVDDREQIVAKSEVIQTRIRNDSLALPLITIPINTVD
ncbi:MAG: hypothetical protein ACLFRF_06710 [Desulfobacterales bacterium]